MASHMAWPHMASPHMASPCMVSPHMACPYSAYNSLRCHPPQTHLFRLYFHWPDSLPRAGALSNAVLPFAAYGGTTDTDKMEAYRHAITQTCADIEKCRVLVLGGGVGTLPMLAMQAGAVHVTAVESNPLTAKMSQAVIRNNGFKRGRSDGKVVPGIQHGMQDTGIDGHDRATDAGGCVRSETGSGVGGSDVYEVM